MKAMIFAAGLGTRLKPVTDNLPKALVPVGGVPLIEIVSRKLVAEGFDEIVVNVHHFADRLCDWIFRQDWASFQVSDERETLLETGGGILHARPLLEGSGSFLVHNVDILSNADLRALVAAHRASAASSRSTSEAELSRTPLATLLVSPRKSSRHFLFSPDDMRLAGWENTASGEVRMSDLSLRPSDCIPLAFSGIHILSDAVFPLLEEYAASLQSSGQSAPAAGTSDSPVCPPAFSIRDFYLMAAREHPIYGINDPGLRILDVGKPESLKQASAFLSTCQDGKAGA